MSLYTVIGAGGFIGSRVVARLQAEGAEIYAPARDDAAIWTRDLGRIFYCAGLTGDYRQRPFDAVEAHASLISRLLEKARFERIVYLSSTRLYDALPDGDGREDRAIPLDANDTRHIYELSKTLGENLTLHQSEGRGAVARLSYVFDWNEGAEGFLSDWLAGARRTRRLSLASSPSNARDYIHVDDVVSGLRVILDSGANQIVNLASGQTLSNAQIAEVFIARGWQVEFTAVPTEVRAQRCDIARLQALGASAQDVLELIDGYLAGL